MRSYSATFVLATLLGCSFLCGCDAKKLQETFNAAPRKPAGTSQGASGQPVAAPPAAPGDSITVASFNIQVFGSSKMSKPKVMEVLANVIRRYDVVAIQELRATDDSIIPRFLQMINAAGAHYDSVVGPRLGRTSSKEQYVFLYNTERLEVDAKSVYTVPDPKDMLHREPLVATFRVRGLPASQAFTFKLVDIHTDPDETTQELNALGDVFVQVQRDGSGEDDVIVLGDLNVDEGHLGKLGSLPGIKWAIAGQPTNTRGNKTYDNIVFDSRATSEYQGYSGVLNMIQEYGLTQQEALEVSDHMPIWARFSAYEGGHGPIAKRPEAAVR